MPVAAAFLILTLLPGSVPAVAPDNPPEKDGEQVLGRYLQASKKNIIRGVSMMAHFAGRLPKLQRTATLNAWRVISNDGAVRYNVAEKSGDSVVIKELIARYIGGEEEAAGKDNSKVALTPDNYKFSYKGLREKDGRMAHVFEVNPRKKRQGLFKGEIWLDENSCLTVREAGRFVKSPSFVLKKVEFAREYTIQEGVAIPKSIQISSQTRYWGMAQLDVQYSAFSWDDVMAQGSPEKP